MEIGVNILNESYRAEEQFVLYQTSGDHRELPDPIKECMTIAQAEELVAGDWITMVDNDIVSIGETHPFLIQTHNE